jgi:predicted cobalt transporter CbtA
MGSPATGKWGWVRVLVVVLASVAGLLAAMIIRRDQAAHSVPVSLPAATPDCSPSPRLLRPAPPAAAANPPAAAASPPAAAASPPAAAASPRRLRSAPPSRRGQ